MMPLHEMDHVAAIQSPEVLFVSMRVYDLLMALLWFKSGKQESDLATSQLTHQEHQVGKLRHADQV
jgi:hypothetical protein